MKLRGCVIDVSPPRLALFLSHDACIDSLDSVGEIKAECLAAHRCKFATFPHCEHTPISAVEKGNNCSLTKPPSTYPRIFLALSFFPRACLAHRQLG